MIVIEHKSMAILLHFAVSYNNIPFSRTMNGEHVQTHGIEFLHHHD
jgi:hypothetical protein